MSTFSGKFFRKKKKYEALDPDEIFLDSSNLPDFDTDQFEGRIEKPISRRTVYFLMFIFLAIGVGYLYRLAQLGIVKGDYYKNIAENNRLQRSLIFGARGVISDRNGELVAWNTIDLDSPDFVKRSYRESPGTHILTGYVKYPKKDKSGFYYNTSYSGQDGVEKYFDNILAGESGLKITETDVQGNPVTDSVVKPEKKGDNIKISIDADMQEALYKVLAGTAKRAGYVGASGALMDLNTGEVIAAVSYPEYNSNVMTDGSDVSTINDYQNSKAKPFLDRLSSGLYAPGSIVKPIFALAALVENVISLDKKILSTGELKVPNPFKQGEFTIFKDWRANGWTNMQEAIAVSSDIYFYEIGGGFMDQKGLGIANIEKYARMFGLGASPENNFFSGSDGVIPSIEWKAKNFNGEIWRVGDTYNTAIGQYGFQLTPIQALRAVSAIATNGQLISPSILSKDDPNFPGKVFEQLPLDSTKNFGIIHDGMRMTVTMGTAKILNVPYVKIAAKTGTAQVGVSNQFINSSVIGFFPYEHPRYSFVIMLERSPHTNTIGASVAMREFVDWLAAHKPEYVGLSKPVETSKDVGTSTASNSPTIEALSTDIGR